jgi:hypothetical protein
MTQDSHSIYCQYDGTSHRSYSTPFGSLIMAKTSILIAFTSAAAVEFSALLVLLFVTETLPTNLTGYESLPNQPTAAGSIDQDEEVDFIEPKSNLLEIISERMHEILASLKTTVRTVAGDSTLVLTLLCFLTTEMGTELVTYMIQYTPKQFGWTLAAVCYHDPINLDILSSSRKLTL